jgi:hypothetical protein
MGDLLKFPHRDPEVSDPPRTGYCIECGTEMPWPPYSNWPDTCPMGCVPLVMTSWKPKGADVHVITDGAGRIIGTIGA